MPSFQLICHKSLSRNTQIRFVFVIIWKFLNFHIITNTNLIWVFLDNDLWQISWKLGNDYYVLLRLIHHKTVEECHILDTTLWKQLDNRKFTNSPKIHPHTYMIVQQERRELRLSLWRVYRKVKDLLSLAVTS